MSPAATPATAPRKGHAPDWPFFLVVTVLILFGLLMISSAGAVLSFQNFGNGYGYFKQQLVSLAVGSVGFFLAAHMHYSKWKRLAVPLLGIAVGLLVLVQIPGIGFSYGGATRWIDMRFTLFQVAEVAKLALVVYLATWLSGRGKELEDFRQGFLPFVAVLAGLGLLVMLQPDLGTMSVLVAIGLGMYFTAGAPVKHIGIAIGGAAATVVFLIAIAPYRINRLLTFLDPSKDTLGTGYHVQQALVAIGSGGLFGLGFNNSVQKYFFLPEPMNDSIFAIIGEELGFFASVVVIAAFTYLAVRGLRVARYAPDTFGRLLAVGFTIWIAWQAMVNIAAMLSLVPLTGVPLPFISLGGSALVALMTGMGILFNVSKYTVKQPEDARANTGRGRRDRRARRAGARRINVT